MKRSINQPSGSSRKGPGPSVDKEVDEALSTIGDSMETQKDERSDGSTESIAWLLKEGALKEWTMTLSAYLERFMDYTVNCNEVNFAEMALLLQNSTSVYSKKVDHAHKLLCSIVDCMNTGKSEEQDLKGEKRTDPKGKSRKRLIDDNLEVLPFVASEHSIDIDLYQFANKKPLKSIVLPTPQNLSRKPGLSTTLFDVNGKEIGTKDDFGLFGKINSNGKLGEFAIHQDKQSSPSCSYSEGNCFDDNDDDVHDNADMLVSSSVDQVGMEIDDLPEQQPSVNVQEDTAQNNLIPSIEQTVADGDLDSHAALTTQVEIENVERCGVAGTSKSSKNLWEPITNDAILPSRPVKVQNTLIVPEPVASSQEYLQLEQRLGPNPRVVKRLLEKEKADELFIQSCVDWIALITGLSSGSGNVRDIALEQRKKKRLLRRTMKLARQLKERREQTDSDDNIDDDVFGNDLPSDDDDEDVPMLTDLMMATNDNDIGCTTYLQDAAAAIHKFKESRLNHASRAADITKRVDMWHQKIAPVLEAAEARKPYDAHEYGTKVLENITKQDDGQGFVPFSKVIGRQPKSEVCRYFLSTLMLANTNNIEIKENENPLQTDCLQIKLLTETRHREGIAEAFKKL